MLAYRLGAVSIPKWGVSTLKPLAEAGGHPMMCKGPSGEWGVATLEIAGRHVRKGCDEYVARDRMCDGKF